jgi:hypothetical protein
MGLKTAYNVEIVAIFLDIAPCSPYVNRHFGETYHLHLHSRKSIEHETSVQQVAMDNAVKNEPLS